MYAPNNDAILQKEWNSTQIDEDIQLAPSASNPDDKIMNDKPEQQTSLPIALFLGFSPSQKSATPEEKKGPRTKLEIGMSRNLNQIEISEVCEKQSRKIFEEQIKLNNVNNNLFLGCTPSQGNEEESYLSKTEEVFQQSRVIDVESEHLNDKFHLTTSLLCSPQSSATVESIVMNVPITTTSTSGTFRNDSRYIGSDDANNISHKDSTGLPLGLSPTQDRAISQTIVDRTNILSVSTSSIAAQNENRLNIYDSLSISPDRQDIPDALKRSIKTVHVPSNRKISQASSNVDGGNVFPYLDVAGSSSNFLQNDDLNIETADPQILPQNTTSVSKLSAISAAIAALSKGPKDPPITVRDLRKSLGQTFESLLQPDTLVVAERNSNSAVVGSTAASFESVPVSIEAEYGITSSPINVNMQTSAEQTGTINALPQSRVLDAAKLTESEVDSKLKALWLWEQQLKDRERRLQEKELSLSTSNVVSKSHNGRSNGSADKNNNNEKRTCMSPVCDKLFSESVNAADATNMIRDVHDSTKASIDVTTLTNRLSHTTTTDAIPAVPTGPQPSIWRQFSTPVKASEERSTPQQNASGTRLSSGGSAANIRFVRKIGGKLGSSPSKQRSRPSGPDPWADVPMQTDLEGEQLTEKKTKVVDAFRFVASDHSSSSEPSQTVPSPPVSTPTGGMSLLCGGSGSLPRPCPVVQTKGTKASTRKAKGKDTLASSREEGNVASDVGVPKNGQPEAVLPEDTITDNDIRAVDTITAPALPALANITSSKTDNTTAQENTKAAAPEVLALSDGLRNDTTVNNDDGGEEDAVWTSQYGLSPLLQKKSYSKTESGVSSTSSVTKQGNVIGHGTNSDIPRTMTLSTLKAMRWADIWKALEAVGWHWSKGRLLVDFYYIRPGRQARGGQEGSDYFIAPEDVLSFLKAQLRGPVGEQTSERIKVRAEKDAEEEVERAVEEMRAACLSQARSDSDNDSEEEEEEEVDAGGVEKGTDARKEAAIQASHKPQEPKHWWHSIDSQPWHVIWSNLQKEGWTWDFGTGLVTSWFIMPGIEKANRIAGVTMLGSESDVIEYVKRTKGILTASSTSSKVQNSRSVSSKETAVLGSDMDWSLLTHRKKRKSTARVMSEDEAGLDHLWEAEEANSGTTAGTSKTTKGTSKTADGTSTSKRSRPPKKDTVVTDVTRDSSDTKLSSTVISKSVPKSEKKLTGRQTDSVVEPAEGEKRARDHAEGDMEEEEIKFKPYRRRDSRDTSETGNRQEQAPVVVSSPASLDTPTQPQFIRSRSYEVHQVTAPKSRHPPSSDFQNNSTRADDEQEAHLKKSNLQGKQFKHLAYIQCPDTPANAISSNKRVVTSSTNDTDEFPTARKGLENRHVNSSKSNNQKSIYTHHLRPSSPVTDGNSQKRSNRSSSSSSKSSRAITHSSAHTDLRKRLLAITSADYIFASLTFLITGINEEDPLNKEVLVACIARHGGKILDSLSMTRELNKEILEGNVFVISHATGFRRSNYLLAIAYGIPVVHPSWVQTCLLAKPPKLLPSHRFSLPAGPVVTQSFSVFAPSVDGGGALANIRVINLAAAMWGDILVAAGAVLCRTKDFWSTGKVSRPDVVVVDPIEYGEGTLSDEYLRIIEACIDGKSTAHVTTVDWVAQCISAGRELNIFDFNLFQLPQNPQTHPSAFKKDGERFALNDVVFYRTHGGDNTSSRSNNSNISKISLSPKSREHLQSYSVGKIVQFARKNLHSSMTNVKILPYIRSSYSLSEVTPAVETRIISSDQMVGKAVVMASHAYLGLEYVEDDPCILVASSTWERSQFLTQAEGYDEHVGGEELLAQASQDY